MPFGNNSRNSNYVDGNFEVLGYPAVYIKVPFNATKQCMGEEQDQLRRYYLLGGINQPTNQQISK